MEGKDTLLYSQFMSYMLLLVVLILFSVTGVTYVKPQYGIHVNLG